MSRLIGAKVGIVIGTLAVGGAAVGVYSSLRRDPLLFDSSIPSKSTFSGFPAFVYLPLESSDQVNHNTKKLRFRLPDSESVSGTALTSSLLTFSWPKGQYLPVLRPYTPISKSNEPGFLELLVKRYPGGKSSTHLHAMEPGQSLLFVGAIKGPQWTPNKVGHVVLIAGGAGITPCYQLAQGILDNPIDNTAVTLIYGVNGSQDFLLKREIEQWEQKFPGRFKAIVTVSRPDDDSPLRKGYVTGALLKEAVPDIGSKQSEVYVCGPPPMEVNLVGDRSKMGVLEELGYRKDQIHKF